MRIALLAAVTTVAFVFGAGSRAEEHGAAETATPYTVECAADAASAEQCTVDKETYVGWRTYHSACNHCHAQDAVGSTFAPSLVSGAAAVRDYEVFVDRVNNGYTGQIGVMPAFKDNPNINKRIDSLYGYLKARADGALPPGRPER